MHQRLSAIVVVGVALTVMWAMFSGGAPSAPPGTAGAVAMAAVVVAAFAAIALDLAGRALVVAVGCAVTLALGIAFGAYTPGDAAGYLTDRSATFALLLGVSAVTALLEEAGWFEATAARACRASSASPRSTFVSLCLLTYALSLFANNLATILVVVPLSLRVAKARRMDPGPLVIGEIIASNLGGASSMIGDFPNMLIADATHLPFHEFLVHLAPICLLELAILLALLARTVPRELSAETARAPIDLDARLDRPAAQRGLALLAVMVVGLFAAGPLRIPIAPLAAGVGLLAFGLGGVSWRAMIQKMCLEEALFFAGLFVMVGGIGATGAFDRLGAELAALSRYSPALGAIAIAWSAAAVTCLFSAGPTTAVMVSVLLAGVAGSALGDSAWWALSLGVCAGSSATITGATAGPAATNLLARHGRPLSFAEFARTGVPVMILFLAIATIYLAALAPL